MASWVSRVVLGTLSLNIEMQIKKFKSDDNCEYSERTFLKPSRIYRQDFWAIVLNFLAKVNVLIFKSDNRYNKIERYMFMHVGRI